MVVPARPQESGTVKAGQVNTTEIAEFVSQLTWERLGPRVTGRAREALRNTTAVMLGGSTAPATQVAAGVLPPVPPDALLAESLSPAAAMRNAFIWGVAASALDYDDGHNLGGGIHPGALIIPALIAVALTRDAADAEEFLTAQVAAYEVAIRAGSILFTRGKEESHYSGTAGCLGAAAGIARLLRLNTARTRHAMEIAWAHAPMAPLHLSGVKESIGWGGATAVVAAHLAEAGFGGHPDDPDLPPGTPFDRPHAADMPLVGSIGREYECLNTYEKKYSACRYTHTAIDSLCLMIDHGLEPANIASITVSVPTCAAYLATKRPASLEEAEYSFPFVLACAALRGNVTPKELNQSSLASEALLRFASKVSVVADPELDHLYPSKRPARLRVTDVSGQHYSELRMTPSGDPDSPLLEAETRAKFWSLAEPILGPHDTAKLYTSLGEHTNLRRSFDLATQAMAAPLASSTSTSQLAE